MVSNKKLTRHKGAYAQPLEARKSVLSSALVTLNNPADHEAEALKRNGDQFEAQMTYMAEHDILTGLPNRVLLRDRLTQAVALAQRHGKKLGLMHLDIDHFKHINHSLGYAIGDQMLRSIAETLQASVRLSDTVSRQGSDEFAVLLPEIEDEQVTALIAEKLIKAVTKPHIIDGHRLYVTLSIGISIYPDDSKDIEAIVKYAETAMYHAKKSGRRNNYQMFTPDMDAHAVARHSIERALHHSFEQEDFILQYQPKVNLNTGVIAGAEALLRWQQSDSDLWPVNPMQFVSIAEECGLILPIGKWVLYEACRQTQEWLQAGLNLSQIAVNFSPIEFLDKDFLDSVHTILADTKLDPDRLVLELTERVLLQETEKTIAKLQALRELGVQIAIDDFGTGYSSLSYLSRLPIDEIKIDQSFVQAIDGDRGKVIVNAIIAMGISLNHRVVAEGIETQHQLSYLRANQCVEGQGYHFSPPVAAEEFAELLRVSGMLVC